MKSGQLLAVVFMLLLSISFVFAAGTSTQTRDGPSIAVTTTDAQAAARDHLAACDSIVDRQERIKCRLQAARTVASEGPIDYERDVIPEACKRLQAATDVEITSITQCRRLYNSLQGCYDLRGEEKMACFRESAGIEGQTVREAAKEKVRHYIVAVLYDVQERLEHAVEEGNVDAEAAAEIIELIVTVKEDIMNGESREIIKPKIQEIREKLQSLNQLTVEDAADE